MKCLSFFEVMFVIGNECHDFYLQNEVNGGLVGLVHCCHEEEGGSG